MSAVAQNAKGPAEAATSPSHGSTNPQKDTEMNENTYNIDRLANPAISRRRVLGFMAAVAVPFTAVVAVAAPEPIQSPQERLEAAIAEMEAAMQGVHGEGVEIVRNKNSIISFLEPKKPPVLEWQGDGDYEVRLDANLVPIFRVVRAPALDDLKEGRCFQLTPRDSDRVRKCYMFENHLKHVLRKVRARA